MEVVGDNELPNESGIFSSQCFNETQSIFIIMYLLVFQAESSI